MSVAFRNVDVDLDAPISTWPYEAIVTLVERGSITDWVLLTREIGADPWGPVARQVEEYLGYESPYGVGPLLARSIDRARRRARRAVGPDRRRPRASGRHLGEPDVDLPLGAGRAVRDDAAADRACRRAARGRDLTC